MKLRDMIPEGVVNEQPRVARHWMRNAMKNLNAARDDVWKAWMTVSLKDDGAEYAAALKMALNDLDEARRSMLNLDQVARK